MLLQDRPIDYSILARACEFYANEGFTQVEVPWVVMPAFSRMTSPTGDDGIAFVLRDGRHLVCSAEQGFIQEVMTGNLVTGREYFSVSPCYRDEIPDGTHSKWFMKLELFGISTSSIGARAMAEEFTIAARRFFTSEHVAHSLLRTDIGVDVMAGDLEIGSYGIRQIGNVYAAYGTGVALPRLQLAKEAL